MADHAVHGQGHGAGAHEEAHASNRTYVQIALILAVITIAEVIIWYLPSVRGVLVPALIILSLAKFVMVVGFFMHLKYDHRLYRFMFAAGLAVTLGVYLAMLAMAWTANHWLPQLPAA
jgi:cytochrome c oxidase subunit 4